MLTAILLAAGESLRFGSPKALAKINERTVLERLQQALMASTVDEIIVVTGAHQAAIEPHVLKHTKLRVVYNKDYKLGQTSSVQTALRALAPTATAFLLLPVDYPLISTTLIDTLVAAFTEQTPTILIPCHNGRRGHPPIFHGQLKDEILRLSPSLGINSVIHAHESGVHILNTESPEVLASFNTPGELAEIRKLARR